MKRAEVTGSVKLTRNDSVNTPGASERAVKCIFHSVSDMGSKLGISRAMFPLGFAQVISSLNSKQPGALEQV